MDEQSFEFYLSVWQLLISLKEPFWTEEEKEKIKKTLREIAVNDPNFKEIDINTPDFLDQLQLKLQSLLVNKPSLPQGNLPPKEIFKDYENYLQQLEEQQKDYPPIIFLRRGQILPFSNEIFQTLKEKGIIDEEGKILTSPSLNPKLWQEGERAIEKLLLYQHWLFSLQKRIEKALEENKIPLSLFRSQFFGSEEVPGIIVQVSQECIHILKKGEEINPQRVEEIVNVYLENAEKYRLLNPKNQQELREKTIKTILAQLENFALSPPSVSIRVTITSKNEDLQLSIVSEREKEEISSFPKKTMEIIKRIQEEKEHQFKSTENIQRFIQSFMEDPISAIFKYPYYSFINLLPTPLKNWYWKKNEMEKKWKLWYGASVNPEIQRKILQDIGWKVIKYLIRVKAPHLINEKGQWVWFSVLGWLGEKTVTFFGESFANLFDKLGKPGKALGKIIHRRIGKERKREESLLTSVLGIVLDLFSLFVSFISKGLIWRLIKKLPIIRKAINLWIKFRYTIESNIPFLKYLRITKGIIGIFIRSSPHGLISSFLVYIASGGNLNATIAIGGADWIFHFIKKLKTIPEIELWIETPSKNLWEKIIRWLLGSKQFKIPFYLPIKSTVFSFILTDIILPALGISLPRWATWIIRISLPLGEYLWQTKIFSFPLRFFHNFSRFGFLSKFLGAFFQKIFFALPYIPLLTDILSGTPALIALNKWINTFWGWIGIGQIVWSFLRGFIPAVLGYSSWGALLSSLWSGVATFFSSLFTAISSAVAGISAFIAAASEIIIVVVAILILIILIIFTIHVAFSAFLESKTITKGLVNPELKITKTLTGTKKDSEGKIIELQYEFSFTYQPRENNSSNSILITKIVDLFYPPLVPSMFDLEKSSFSPCVFVYQRPETEIGGGRLVWENLEKNCPQLAFLSPNETKILKISLRFNPSWQDTPILKNENICNVLAVWAEKSDGSSIDSSLPQFCVSPEGKVASPWNITWPIDSDVITSCFNEDRGSYFHKGLDIGTVHMNPSERDVVAIDDGEVIFSGGSEEGTYGYFIEIKHKNGWISRYAHLSPKNMIEIGKKVTKGEKIGISDNSGQSTGPHLHLEIRKDDPNKCGLAVSSEFSECWVDPLCFYPLKWNISGCPVPYQCKLK